MMLDLQLSDSRADLVGEGFELALRIGDPGNLSFVARRLCTLKFTVAAAPAFLERVGELQSPEDLNGLPCVVYTNVPRGAIIRWEDDKGSPGQAELVPSFRSNNGEFLREMAIRGHGIVAEPRFILDAAIAAGDLVELFPGTKWQETSLYAVYPPTDHMPARLRALIDHLARHLRG